MKIYFRLLCAVGMMLYCSCKKYLDVTPQNVGTIDYAFRNRNEAENYLFTCYSTLQRLSNQQYDAGFVTSSEIIFPNNLRDNGGIDPSGFNLIRGTQTAGNPALNYWDGANGGQPIFQALRRCNIMLENIDKPVDLSADEKKRWIAEVNFLKAYYHFYLFRMYGPIPIIDVNLPISSSEDAVKVKRAPVDSVINYIVQLLDKARPDLPVVITNQAKELGRITQPIALSVKAYVLATAASPLFNGNPDYAGIKDKDGQFLFNSTYDATKWDKAAAACQEAITVSEANGIKLHQFIPSVSIPADLTDSLRTVLTLQTATTEKWDVNTELIWALNPTFNFQIYCGPKLTQKADANPVFWGTWAVSINEQELFYTSHGVPIEQDKTWDYINRYDLRTGDSANRFYIGLNYQTVKAHFDREPRFYAYIGFDGGIWYGNGNLNQNGAYYVQGRSSSAIGGPTDNLRLNVSGYWPKKLVNYQTVYDDGASFVDFRLPMIRLAGMYLLYAEILNEQGKSYTEVATWIDKVRQRAGLPGVVDAWTNYSRTPNAYATKDGMRKIIHQETRIELAFECEPGWDLRRWKELQAVLSKPIQGWNIYEADPLNYYRQNTLAIPVFNVRDYLWPINANSLVVDPNLTQNLNW